MNNEANRVAMTIAAQIGNGAFAMMGAKNLLSSADSLQWKIGRNAKAVTHITVRLDPSDTYTVIFHRVTKRGLSVVVKAEVAGVYVDSLHAVIESETGLYMNL